MILPSALTSSFGTSAGLFSYAYGIDCIPRVGKAIFQPTNSPPIIPILLTFLNHIHRTIYACKIAKFKVSMLITLWPILLRRLVLGMTSLVVIGCLTGQLSVFALSSLAELILYW